MRYGSCRAARRTLSVTLLVLACFFYMPVPEAQAIDPVTMAILAPIALKVAEKARPYVIAGLKSGLSAMLEMGVDMLKIFYLPLGVVESTLGAPFGFFGTGVVDVGKGLWAPFVVTWDALLLPIKFLGVQTQ